MSQAIFTADPDFAGLAMDEVRQSATDVQMETELDPGVLLVTFGESFWELAETWREFPPIFVRHICPAQTTVSLDDREADLQTIQEATEREIVPYMDAVMAFSVQTRVFGGLAHRPFEINNLLASVIGAVTGAPLNVREPEQVVSVVCAGQPRGNLTAHLGLSLVEHNLSDWAGGVRRFAREKDQVSRSEFKLLEALDVFHIDLPPRGVALDLGAAPGGWTRVLRQREQYVTAVDPAELAPRLAGDRSVRHKPMTAEAYLAGEPDQFDLIVNDMRMDARDSSRLMVAYARQLYPDGIALMTFKLPEVGRRQVLDHAFHILEDAYQIAGARQLFHNRSEITVYMKRKAGKP